MIKNPLFSIIIPVYNTASYLDGCVNCILNQSYKNFELILIDDGSTDGSSVKCDEYSSKDKRILCIHKSNGGVSSARNVGIEAASGQYVWFCDSDDQMCSGALDKLAVVINSVQPLMVAFPVEQINENAKRVGLIPAPKASRLSDEGPLQCDDLLYPYAHVFKRGLIGDVRFDTSLSLLEDRDFLYKMFWKAAGSVAIVHDPLYRYLITREDSAVNCSSLSKYVASTRVQYEILLHEKSLGYVMPAFRIFASHSLGVLSLIVRQKGSRNDFKLVRSRLVEQRNLSSYLKGFLKVKYMLAVYMPHVFWLLAFVSGVRKEKKLGSTVLAHYSDGI